MNRKRGRWRVQLLLCSECPQALLQAHQAGLLGCTEIASLLCPILPPSAPMSAQALPDPRRLSCPAGHQRRNGPAGLSPGAHGQALWTSVRPVSSVSLLCLQSPHPPSCLSGGRGSWGSFFQLLRCCRGSRRPEARPRLWFRRSNATGPAGVDPAQGGAGCMQRPHVGWLPGWPHSPQAWLSGPLGTLRATKILWDLPFLHQQPEGSLQ